MSYEVVHVTPDKQERVVSTISSQREISMIVDTSAYAGAWLTPTRKVLRYNRGYIIIREVDETPAIVNCREISIGPFTKLFELDLRNVEGLRCILLNDRKIAGYSRLYYESEREHILWEVNSFSKLADIIGKDLAYQCIQYYQQYCQEYQLPEVM